MKITIQTFLLIVLLSSCCREYNCVKGRGIGVQLVGFSTTVRDSVTLFFFKKNDLFNQAVDSMKGPGIFFDTTSTIFIQSLNYDYALKVVADTFYISNLQEKLTSYKACFGECVKMGECQLFYTYIVNGNKTPESGNVITITK